jgi:hypothetical protein
MGSRATKSYSRVARVRGQTTRVIVSPTSFDDGPETALFFPALDDDAAQLFVKDPRDIEDVVRSLNGWKPS